MTSRDPKGAVRQYGRLSWLQLGFLLAMSTLLFVKYLADPDHTYSTVALML